jgi:probable rRNA maturation factor
MSDIDIQISDRQQALDVNENCLRRTIEQVLDRLEVPGAVVSVAIVDDTAISELTHKYFGRSEATDVLSFDLRDETRDTVGDGRLDCEVIVNGARALQVARAQDRDPQAELHLYVVHGLLHQLGYDDQSDAQAQKMHAEEDRLLQELGFGKVFSPDH